MRKLLDKALCEVCQSIQIYEQRCSVIRTVELDTWKFWVRWRLAAELEFLTIHLNLLYRQKLRILDLMDKYEVDPLS